MALFSGMSVGANRDRRPMIKSAELSTLHDPRPRVRVLCHVKNLNGGGAERVVVDLCARLDRSRFEPRILLVDSRGAYQDIVPRSYLFGREKATREPRSMGSRARRRVEKIFIAATDRWLRSRYSNRLTCVDNGAVKRLLLGLLCSQQLKEFRHAIRSYKPDIVITNLLESSSAIMYLIRYLFPQEATHVRWIAVEHNNTRRRFDFVYSGQDLKAWCGLVPRVYALADTVVAVSSGVAEGLSKHFGLSGDRVKVIYNHVDVEAVRNVPPIRWPRPFVLAAGRLHPQKDFQSLIRAFALAVPDSSVDLVILGEGEDRPLLEALAGQLGIRDRVYLLGWRSDLWSFMHSASCFVSTSKFEGFGLVLVEAMSAGCPVIAYNCEYGPSEIITHGVDGLLVPPEDEGAMAQAIGSVLRDCGQAHRLGRAGRDSCERFAVSKMVSEYEHLMQSLVK